MPKQTVQVPVQVRLSAEDIDGVMVCRICIICSALVPEEMIQNHLMVLHDTHEPEVPGT